MRFESLTHQTIADYVGTSREIVTSEMNRIRQLGLIHYNRHYIDVYPNAVAEALRHRIAPERDLRGT
jgi:CRP-like cAMP-binding protein